jgi:hypothetical protein
MRGPEWMHAARKTTSVGEKEHVDITHGKNQKPEYTRQLAVRIDGRATAVARNSFSIRVYLFLIYLFLVHATSSPELKKNLACRRYDGPQIFAKRRPLTQVEKTPEPLPPGRDLFRFN